MCVVMSSMAAVSPDAGTANCHLQRLRCHHNWQVEQEKYLGRLVDSIWLGAGWWPCQVSFSEARGRRNLQPLHTAVEQRWHGVELSVSAGKLVESIWRTWWSVSSRFRPCRKVRYLTNLSLCPAQRRGITTLTSEGRPNLLQANL